MRSRRGESASGTCNGLVDWAPFQSPARDQSAACSSSAGVVVRAQLGALVAGDAPDPVDDVLVVQRGKDGPQGARGTGLCCSEGCNTHKDVAAVAHSVGQRPARVTLLSREKRHTIQAGHKPVRRRREKVPK